MLTYRFTGVYVYMFVYTYIKLVCISLDFTRFNPVTVATNILGIILWDQAIDWQMVCFSIIEIFESIQDSF